jgi:hypothetical protein
MDTVFLRAHASHPAARAAMVLGIILVLSAACSDSNPAAPSAPSPRSLTVIIVPVEPEYQATAAAAFSDGSSREVTREVQWTSTKTDVAVVSDTGRVTPIAPGATEIRGTYQSVSGSAQLTVASPPPPPWRPPHRHHRRHRHRLRRAHGRHSPIPKFTVSPSGSAMRSTAAG